VRRLADRCEPVAVATAVVILDPADRAGVVRPIQVAPLGELVQVPVERLGRREAVLQAQVEGEAAVAVGECVVLRRIGLTMR